MPFSLCLRHGFCSESEKVNKIRVNVIVSFFHHLVVFFSFCSISRFLGRLDVLAEEIQTLKKKQADACASLTEAKRRQVELAHRVLRVLVKQESTRKVGFTLGREEEQLMSQLEGVAAELATPTQFRGRLHELLSCVRYGKDALFRGG